MFASDGSRKATETHPTCGFAISPYLFIMVMEVASKLLEQAVDNGNIRLHPGCVEPRVTHLLFADDLLVFSDGSRHSISGIKRVMSSFRDWSGLDMNASKSEIFFGGYEDIESSVISDISGFKIGTFPTRYLGLPLNPSRISQATLQPFVERITSKLNNYTVKLLSFAGKVQLIVSVIYGLVNFWSSVFVLPKSFYKKIDGLCYAFLWKNRTDSAAGARVSGDNICKPKMEGGLGIRKLEDSEMVSRLKRIWNYFSSSGHLGCLAPTKCVTKERYWQTMDSQRFSPTVRSMLQLKPVITDLMRCTVGNGNLASFWYDSWTSFGPLINFIGHRGPTKLRLPLDSLVSQAVRNGNWYLPPARSNEIQKLQIELTTINPPSVAAERDTFLWRSNTGQFVNTFSSKATWEFIRIQYPHVNWSKAVWFKEEIPAVVSSLGWSF